MNSAGILLQNSGVLQSRSIFCPAELMWFSISMRYWTIWPLTHGKQEVADEGSGFLVMIWHANCSSQDATRNLHNKCIYSRILNIFFSNLLSYSFQKAIAFCDWYIALVDRVKRVHYAPCYCNVSNMHFIYWCILYICGCISVRIFRNMYKCNVHEALARMRGILDRSERDLTNNTGSYHTSLSYNWE